MHLLQNAIDPETDAKLLVQRFEMNIACASAVRLDQQHGDKTDNWRVGFIDCGRFRAITNFQSEIDVVSDFFLQDVGCFVRRPVVFDQCITNFLGTGAYQFQLALQEKTQAVDRIDIQWITDRHYETGVAEGDRDHFEAARVFASDLIDDLRRNHHGRDVDPIHVRLRCERARDLHVRDNSVVD